MLSAHSNARRLSLPYMDCRASVTGSTRGTAPGMRRQAPERLRARALVRDEKGELQVWVVQMESAGQALKDGITKESFPQGTVFSMGIHPLRDGKPGGDRGNSGLFQCPKGNLPKPGLHCDSVEGNKSFGPGVLPKDGAKTTR